MTRFRHAAAGLLAVAVLTPAPAQTGTATGFPERNSVAVPTRPRVVLVLSGGGARGVAHIGVLEALEELHVPVDMIVGTSMGSIVGGLYASGWSTEEIEHKVATIDWGAVFVDRLPRRFRTYRRKQDDVYLVPIKMRFKNWKPYIPASLLGGQALELLLQGFEIDATGERDFDAFPIRFRAVAADLSTGQAVVLDHGHLATAMRASMSIPGVFPPVELDGRPLCDGGVAANYPIRAARALGAETIIGVDISSPLDEREARGNLLQRLDQLTTVMMNANKSDDLVAAQPQDVLLTPELGAFSFSDFARAGEAIAAGRAAARAAAGRLKALAVSDAEWAAYTARHVRRPASDRVVDEFRIVNGSYLDTRVVARRLSVPVGKPLDEEGLATQILALNGLDTFGTIHHDLTRRDGKNVLTVETPEKPYSRNSLQFGFNFEDDFRGGVTFNLAVSQLMNPVDRLGGEWRNVLQIGDNNRLGTEFYQPLDADMAWFARAVAGIGQDTVVLYDAGGRALAQYSVRTGDVRAGAGRNFRNWGQWEAGVFRSRTTATPRIAAAGAGRQESDDGGAYGAIRVDTFDSFVWPRHGVRVDASYEYGIDTFGANARGGTAHLAVAKAGTVGKNVVFGSIEGTAGREPSPVLGGSFFLGGFLRLSGLRNDELIGRDGGLARVLYYRELSSFSLGSLTQRMFAGMSLEAGNVHDAGDRATWRTLRNSASLFAGADTILGPAYLGVGFAEGGRTAVYLIIGRRF